MKQIHALGYAGREVMVICRWNGVIKGTLTTDGEDWYIGDYLWVDCIDAPMYLMED